ncbi:MAG: hypothetical protein JXA50_11055 [Deltaproteobacteria bacterium]|nr:hypothetical protein [Deltaproteobacteria bacterium]
MTSRKKALAGLGLAFLVGGVIGLAIGGYVGMRLMVSFFGNNWLHEQAADVQTRIVILKHLRAAERNQAIELLEAQLDDDLISIEPDKYINDQTISDINNAIHEAREYRSNHPRASNRPHVDTMVKNVFSQEPYK